MRHDVVLVAASVKAGCDMAQHNHITSPDSRDIGGAGCTMIGRSKMCYDAATSRHIACHTALKVSAPSTLALPPSPSFPLSLFLRVFLSLNAGPPSLSPPPEMPLPGIIRHRDLWPAAECGTGPPNGHATAHGRDGAGVAHKSIARAARGPTHARARARACKHSHARTHTAPGACARPRARARASANTT